MPLDTASRQVFDNELEECVAPGHPWLEEGFQYWPWFYETGNSVEIGYI